MPSLDLNEHNFYSALVLGQGSVAPPTSTVFSLGRNGYGKGKNGKDGGKRERMGTNDIFLESVGKEGEELGNSFSGKSEKDRKEWYRMGRNEIFS